MSNKHGNVFLQWLSCPSITTKTTPSALSFFFFSFTTWFFWGSNTAVHFSLKIPEQQNYLIQIRSKWSGFSLRRTRSARAESYTGNILQLKWCLHTTPATFPGISLVSDITALLQVKPSYLMHGKLHKSQHSFAIIMQATPLVLSYDCFHQLLHHLELKLFHSTEQRAHCFTSKGVE